MSTIQAIQAVLQDHVAIEQIPKHFGDKEIGNEGKHIMQQRFKQQALLYKIDEENIIKFSSIQIESGSNREETEEKDSKEKEGKEEGDIIDIDQIQNDIESKQNKKTKQIQNEETNVETVKSNKSNVFLKELRSMSSSVLDDNYFKEDTKSSENLQMKRAQQDISKIKNYFMKFRCGTFLEFFIIHFLYFYLLGPFLIPFLRLRGKFLARNLLFQGFNSGALFQFLIYSINILCILFYFYYDNPSISLEIEFFSNVLSVIARCILISIKYATYDPMKIQIIRSTLLPYDVIVQDFFLTSWKQQNAKIVGEQIYNAQRSYDIDPGLFYIQFIVEPEEPTQKRLAQNQKTIYESICKNHVCKKPVPVAKMKENDVLYNGYTILFDIIQRFENKCKYSLIIIMRSISLFTLVRALIPILYHYWTFGASAYGTWHELFIAITSAFQLFALYLTGSQIMMYGIIDLKRKLEMLRQLTFMIAPRKLKDFEMKKIYPSLNIFRSVNLKGWSLLRQVSMEYGKPYLLRVQAFFVFLGFWLAGNLVQLILYQYNLYQQNTAQMIQNYMDACYILFCVFSMLVIGAKINDLFDIQENILNSNKTIVTDLLLVGPKYIEKSKKSQSFIYNKAIEKVIEVGQDNIESYIDNLIESYDSHIEELVYDSEYNPFTLFGIKVNFVFLQSVIVAVGGVAATLVTKFLQSRGYF